MTPRPRHRATIGLIGAGRAGGSMAVLLAHGGWAPSVLWSRSLGRRRTLARRILRITGRSPACRSRPADVAREARILLLAVPDDALAGMAVELAAACPHMSGRVILHLSGVAGLTPLLPLRERGASTGSLHPLAIFSSRVPPPDLLLGAGFAVDGQPRARSVARSLARALGGRPFSIDTRLRPLYHLAASLVANDVLAIFHLAHRALCKTGLQEKEAHQVLVHLLQGTATALAQTTAEAALTGPVSRGDAGTLARHLSAAPDARTASIHRLLSLVLVDMACTGDRMGEATARRLRHLLAASPGQGRNRR
ncbi:MAG: DUF2520 domain-containing protein [Acidobacteria bacterium]|nr:MAG: DUF2520 domain-containing protein [Acidobacteriota bacterium]